MWMTQQNFFKEVCFLIFLEVSTQKQVEEADL